MVKQEKLIIYLHSTEAEQPSWAVVDADGMVRQSASRDNASGLAEIAEDKEVIVIVPAEKVLLTAVKLPKMNRSRLLQAVPYALEDELIDEVDALHFAIDEYHADRDLPVAVVAHEHMQQWLNVLQSFGIQADSIMPAMFALPYEAEAWHVAISELVVVRTGLFQGFAGDKQNLATLLDAALMSSLQMPAQIHLHNYTNHAFSGVLEIPAKIQEDFLKESDWIKDFARHAAKNAGSINLLQGPYAVKKFRLPQMNKLWKITAGLAIAWVFLLFFYPALSYFILKHRMNAIEDQVAEIYKRNFPQASSIVAPKLRMQEKLQNLNADRGASRLLLLLGYVGKGMAETPNIKLSRFDFQSNQLSLELTAATSDDFSAFTDYLTQQGLSVKQQNANLVGSRINATLLIE